MIYARSLIAIGVCGLLFFGGRLAFVGLSHAGPLTETYYACPEGGEAHRLGCPHVNWSRTDLIKLGPQAVEASELRYCERCASESDTARTSTASPSPPPAGTARPPSPGAGR